ncbi:hypothetical protein D1007_09204 [Hordeum vulgare]|nr:hypothetical protein D1007_09204 [Hordeum vulgare]
MVKDQSEDLDDSEDINYVPSIKEDESLGAKDFFVPEDPLDQEVFKQQLITTARSLKIKQRQLKAEQDSNNERWTKGLILCDRLLQFMLKFANPSFRFLADSLMLYGRCPMFGGLLLGLAQFDLETINIGSHTYDN